MSGERAWSAEEIWALGERARVEDAASVLGIGKHKAYEELNAHGRLTAIVNGEKFLILAYQVCDRWWVPMKPIRQLLYIETEDSPLGLHTRLTQGGNGDGGPASAAVVSVPTTPTPQKERIIHEPG